MGLKVICDEDEFKDQWLAVRDRLAQCIGIDKILFDAEIEKDPNDPFKGVTFAKHKLYCP